MTETVAYSVEQLIEDGVLTIGDGYRAKNSELGGDGLIFLRSAYLQDDGFVLSNPDRFVEHDATKYQPKVSSVDDVVITTKGNSTGRLGRISERQAGAVYSPHLSYWRSQDTDKLDPGFLYYWCRSSDFRTQLVGFAHSTDMAPYLSLRDQLRFVVPTPAIEQQRAIAHILGTLDDKIELNRRMNETLEAMARALFKEWFVDFGPVRAKAEGLAPPGLSPEIAALFPDALDDEDKPVGWEEGTLGDVARCPSRGVLPGEVADDTPYIGLEHMPRQSIALSEWEGADKVTSNKTRFKRGEFLFGKLRPYFHKVGIAPVDGICSTDIVVVVPKTPHWASFVLSCISTKEFVDYTDQSSTGTKMPRTSWAIMGNFKLTLPPVKVAQAFDRIARPMTDRILDSIHESQTLTHLRDTLLPKLMSGEIRVGEAERRVEAVL